MLMLSSKPCNLNEHEQQLLKVVGQRVTDKPLHTIVNGPALTDGKTIWLPLNPPQFSLKELIGITAHEASHLRFHSVFGTNIREIICPENPILGGTVLNILEDARVDFLLKEAYPGFWIELDQANKRQALISIKQMADFPENILYSHLTANFLLRLLNLDLTGNISLILAEDLRLPSGRFKFGTKLLGKFWNAFLAAKAYLFKFLSFPATVIAGQRVIKAIEALLLEFSKQMENDQGRSQTEKGLGENDDAPENSQEQHSSKEEDEFLESSQEQLSPKEDNNSPGKTHFDNRENEDQSDGEENLDDETEETGEQRPNNSGFSAPLQESVKEELSIANQTLEIEDINLPNDFDSSSINFENLKGIEKIILEELQEDLKENPDDLSALEEKFEEQLNRCRKNIQDIVESCRNSTQAGQPPKNPIEKVREDGKEIEIHLYETSEELQRINWIENPAQEYDNIVRQNRNMIDQLRCQLQQIKTSAGYERGGRRGIVCSRDLSRVVSSKGTFNRPFLTPQNNQGANLLIVVDESYSMLDSSSIEIAKQSAIILAEALKGTRIAYGVVGFTARTGCNIIAEKIYKRFGESNDPSRLGCIWSSQSYTDNRDGTSFQTIAERHFKNFQGNVPIMLIISDGKPNHGKTCYVGPKAIKHTTETVRSLKQRLKMFMLSIDLLGNTYLPNIYGKHNYVVLQSPQDLTQKLIFLVKSIAANLV